MVKCEKCKNGNERGRIKDVLLAPNYPLYTFSGNGDCTCFSCKITMNRVYIKNYPCHPFSPEFKEIGWICLRCGSVETNLEWFNSESEYKASCESTEKRYNYNSEFTEKRYNYNSELELWLRELERSKEENDRFNCDQAKKQIKQLLGV